MSLSSSLKFHITFFRDSIPIMLNTIKFLFFSVLYKLLRIDPSADSTFFSFASLPLPGGRAGKLKPKPCPYTKMNANANGVRDLGFVHEFREPRPNDYRSPCPALNVMANHGYIPRDGKNLTGTNLTRGLIECYNLSWPLAAFLAWGGVLLLGQVGHLSLHDLARHNRIEHDASLTHPNTPRGEEYAPTRSDERLFNAFLGEAKEGGGKVGLSELARARVRREREEGEGMTSVQQEIARGEVALVIQIFGGGGAEAGRELAVPVDVIETWWGQERLPRGWSPTTKTTLRGTINWAAKIRAAMQEIRDVEQNVQNVQHEDESARGAVSTSEARLFADLEQTRRHRDSNGNGSGSATPPTPPTSTHSGSSFSESTSTSTSSSVTSSPPPPTPTSIAPASPLVGVGGGKKETRHQQVLVHRSHSRISSPAAAVADDDDDDDDDVER